MAIQTPADIVKFVLLINTEVATTCSGHASALCGRKDSVAKRLALYTICPGGNGVRSKLHMHDTTLVRKAHSEAVGLVVWNICNNSEPRMP